MSNHAELHKRVRNLQFRYQDLVDLPDHPTARSVRAELQRLEDEVQEQKNPRSLEGRIQTIQHFLEQAQNGEPIMDPRHSVALIDEFERMRRELRTWPEY